MRQFVASRNHEKENRSERSFGRLRASFHVDTASNDVDWSSASSEGHPVSGTEVSRSLPVSRSA